MITAKNSERAKAGGSKSDRCSRLIKLANGKSESLSVLPELVSILSVNVEPQMFCSWAAGSAGAAVALF